MESSKNPLPHIFYSDAQWLSDVSRERERETRNFFHYNVIGFSTIKSYSKFTVMKSYVPWELLKQEILSG